MSEIAATPAVYSPIDNVLAGQDCSFIAHADALEFLRQLPDCSVDSCVTDPPAGIGFMGKNWDKNKGSRDKWIAWLEEIMREVHRVLKPGGHALVWALPRTSHWTGFALENAGFEVRDVLEHIFGSGFPKSLNVSKAIDKAEGATRKVTGSYVLSGTAAMSLKEKGGTFSAGIASNGHRKEILITAPESDAAKEWDGWGTALKPAHEYWWLVRKPLEGTIAANIQEHGTGALNVDATRIGTNKEVPASPARAASGGTYGTYGVNVGGDTGHNPNVGRWPANLLLTHSAGCRVAGTHAIKANPTWDTPNRECEPTFTGDETSTVRHADSSGMERVILWECAEDCPVHAMDKQSGTGKSSRSMRGTRHALVATNASGPNTLRGHSDSGTASRYFPQFQQDPEQDDPELWPNFIYSAKPSRKERDAGLESFRARSGGEATGREDGADGTMSPRAGAGRKGGARNVHPTVKSVAFIRYLQRLITPPGGVTLDVFVGSGTHGVAAIQEGFRFLGCEMNDTDEEPFVSIARARCAHAEGKTYVPRESLRAEPVPQGSMF